MSAVVFKDNVSGNYLQYVDFILMILPNSRCLNTAVAEKHRLMSAVGVYPCCNYKFRYSQDGCILQLVIT